MSLEAPWYRAQSDWMFSDWILELGYPAAGILHWFLGHVKTHGNNRGKCRRIPDAVFARMYGLPESDVDRFLQAAAEAGAIVDDGKTWEVTGWTDYQSPDATRKRAERDRQAIENPENVTDKPDLSVTNATCPVACHATTTVTGTVTGNSQLQELPTAKVKSRGSQKTASASPARRAADPHDPNRPNHCYLLSERVQCQIADAVRDLGFDWADPTVPEIRRYMANDGPLWQWVCEDGEDAVVEQFLWAFRNWKSPPSGLDVVYRNRRGVKLQMAAPETRSEPRDSRQETRDMAREALDIVTRRMTTNAA